MHARDLKEDCPALALRECGERTARKAALAGNRSSELPTGNYYSISCVFRNLPIVPTYRFHIVIVCIPHSSHADGEPDQPMWLEGFPGSLFLALIGL